MRIILKSILAAAILAASTTFAYAADVRGVGAATCSTLLKANAESSAEERPHVIMLTESWAYGYMARLNFDRENAGQRSADLSGLTPGRLYPRIIADCRAHPNDRVFEAVHRIYMQTLQVS